MIKFIRNSKGSRANKTSNYRGVRFISGKYQANIILTQYNNQGKRKQTTYVIGSFNTEKEAMNERVKFILGLL
jgi:hypothetical protein